ncbi:GTPase domain-containing protein [Cellulomonas rhizosphaerae]|uniref:ABC transporter n=1 Tax=Cellulomonas rhizosphaerae TaxID=2293719 RepID=A0A413RQQ0_9CELL|nr:GTPase domain-containing protein [Cellulomonas rhizosphaerae]RHA44322.1 ABC transporter [Cellulomonas rhizosphaerae]
MDAHDPPRPASALTGSLEDLRTRLTSTRLPLDAPGATAARRELTLAVEQLDDYVLPRLRAQGAPLLVVVGGSTGAGKSTLVNSLLGEHVSVPGVLRPTTRSPVLAHHPLDARWFSTDRVLPGLARVTADGPQAGGARALRLVGTDALPQGLALLDAPDIDSVEVANRELAAQLLAAADLWLFVTTAARYADAVPWELLIAAAERRAQVALVVDRVDPGAEAVVGDLRRLMDEHGLGGSPLFAIPESALVEGLLPLEAVGEVAAHLSDLGADPDARDAVVGATLDGVVDDLVRRTLAIAAASDAQVEADARLRDVSRRYADDAVARVAAATSDGSLLRGEVLARWQDFVGTGEFFRSIEQRVGRARDAVVGFFRGKPAQAPDVEQAIAHGLEAVLLDAIDEAAERTFESWRADPAGAGLLVGLDLSRGSGATRGAVAEQIRLWQGDVLELVREQGADKRGTARALSFGLNGLGVSLMVLVFASTGGLTGIEVGIAGGTAVVAQKLLEAVFGDEAVRRLTTSARERLEERVRGLLDVEAARYVGQLDALGTATGEGDALRGAADAVERAATGDRSSPTPERVRIATTAVELRGATHWREHGSQPTAAVPEQVPEQKHDEEKPSLWRRIFGRRDQA